MALWKQTLVALVLVAAAVLAWAAFVPAAGPLLSRLGLPAPEAPAAPEAAGPRGGFAGPAGVASVPVAEGRANARVSAIGDGRALRSVAVRPLDSGVLTDLAVASGATVRPGDVIARLDQDLEEIALERATLVAEDAAATYARVEELRARGAATDVQEREARLALERARLEARDAALALERRTILAPIGGVVGLLEVEAGMRVDETTELAVIEDRSSLLVEFRVPERVVGALAVGDLVSATPLARPELALEGRVSALDNRIDLDSRTLRVQAALPNAEDRLRSGMAFSIEMRLPGDPYPEVDALAIQWSDEGAFVWVARDGRAVREPVRIVQRNAGRALVAASLAPGEPVITEGVQRLREGDEVRLLGEPPAPDDPGEAGAAADAPSGGASTREAARPVSGG
jgi:RND family efflux transporter MFP subunit